MPLVFIREQIDDSNTVFQQTKEVVDGQQRLRALFDYIDGGFPISTVHNKEYGGKKFRDLPNETQMSILYYSITTIRLVGQSDSDISEIFARLNTYSVKLNSQEILHSQYFGEYRQTVNQLATEYRAFFINNGILTEKKISRMEDKKLINNILDPIVTGEIRSLSQNALSKTYKQYDDVFDNRDEIVTRIERTVDLLCKVYPDTFEDTAFTSTPLFGSTILAMYHMNWPIDCFDFGSSPISEASIPELRTALDEINMVSDYKEEDTHNPEILSFLDSIRLQTTNPSKVTTRCKYVGETILKYCD